MYYVYFDKIQNAEFQEVKCGLSGLQYYSGFYLPIFANFTIQMMVIY